MFFEALRRVQSIAQRHRGKTCTPTGITRLIRSQFRDSQLRFRTLKNSQVEFGNWWIGGQYDPVDDQEERACIHINLTFNPRQRKMKIDDMDWDNFAFHVADVVTHEYLHQYYVRRRGYQFGLGYRRKIIDHTYADTMKNYLGCEDEILAFSFSAAAEMLVYKKSFDRTQVARMYRRHFKTDQKVVLQLKKQTCKYIKRWEQSNEQTSPGRIHNR